MRVILATYFFALVAADSSFASHDNEVSIDVITEDNYTSPNGYPFLAYNLQEALFPSGNAWYGFDDNGTAELGYDSPHLFIEGCRQPDGSRDCSVTCNDSAAVFADLQALHNCMAYPTVATLYRNKRLNQFSNEVAQNLGIAPFAPLQPIKDIISSSPIFRHVQKCLTEYCDDTVPGCKQAWASNSWLKQQNGSDWDFGHDGDRLLSTICHKIPAVVDSDIGGVGIYVSYWIQSGIALLGFLATILLQWWISNASLCIFTLTMGFERAKEKARRIQRSNQKHLSRLAAALTDFQKAQCFYMLATNIAALFVVKQGSLNPTSLQQIYNTYIFIKVLAVSGYLPVTFVLFTLHLIGMVSWYLLVLSFFSVALSIITLRTIGTFTPSPANVNDLLAEYSSGGPDSCGGKKPGAFCLTTGESSYDYDNGDGSYRAFSPDLRDYGVGESAYRVLGFCLVILLLSVIEQSKFMTWPIARRCTKPISSGLAKLVKVLRSGSKMVSRAMKDGKFRRITRCISSSWNTCLHIIEDLVTRLRWKFATSPVLAAWICSCKQLCSSLIHNDRYIGMKDASRRVVLQCWDRVKDFHQTADYYRKCMRFTLIAVYVVFSSLYIYWFKVFLEDLSLFAKAKIYKNTWNFGQVVAITVWAPPICEFIHLETRGMKRGFEHRLLAPYQITRMETPDLEIPLHDRPRLDEHAEELLDRKYQKVDSRSPSLLPEARLSEDSDSWQLPKEPVSSDLKSPV